MLPRGSANKSWQSRRGIFLTGRVVSFCRAQGGWRGKRWSLQRPEAGWPCRRGKEEKGIHRGVEKAAGDRTPLYLHQSCELADWPAPTPCRTRRAVKGFTKSLNRMA